MLKRIDWFMVGAIVGAAVSTVTVLIAIAAIALVVLG